MLISAGKDNYIKIWNLESMVIIKKINIAGNIKSIRLSGDNYYLACI